MSTGLELKWSTLEELNNIAKELLHWNQSNKIFLFYGEMGIGKTTLIKCLCNQLNIHDEVTSPSFSVMQVYGINQNIYHWDLFRIQHESELIDLGWLEYLESSAFHFVEWAERVEQLLPQRGVKVKMNKINEIHYLHATCIEL